MSRKRKIVNSSEDIRRAIMKTGLNARQREIFMTIAVRVDWDKPAQETAVRLSNPEIAAESGICLRHVQRVTKYLRDAGYLEIRTLTKYCPYAKRRKNVGNEFRVSPLLFLNAERAELQEKIREYSSAELLTDELKDRMKEVNDCIDKIVELAMKLPERPESLRGRKGSELKKLGRKRQELENSIGGATLSQLSQLDVKRGEIQAAATKIKNESPATISYIYPKKCHPLVTFRSPSGDSASTPGCHPIHPPVTKESDTLNTLPNKNIQSVSNSHSMKKSQKGLSQIFIRMVEMNLFDRFSEAVGQQPETEHDRKRFARTVLGMCGKDKQYCEKLFRMLEKNLRLVETVPVLQEPSESGRPHTLGRLLCDLEKEVVNGAELSFASQAKQCGGRAGKAYGAARLAKAYGWDEEKTVAWLAGDKLNKPATGDAENEISTPEEFSPESAVPVGSDSASEEAGEPARRGQAENRQPSDTAGVNHTDIPTEPEQAPHDPLRPSEDNAGGVGGSAPEECLGGNGGSGPIENTGGGGHSSPHNQHQAVNRPDQEGAGVDIHSADSSRDLDTAGSEFIAGADKQNAHKLKQKVGGSGTEASHTSTAHLSCPAAEPDYAEDPEVQALLSKKNPTSADYRKAFALIEKRKAAKVSPPPEVSGSTGPVTGDETGGQSATEPEKVQNISANEPLSDDFCEFLEKPAQESACAGGRKSHTQAQSSMVTDDALDDFIFGAGEAAPVECGLGSGTASDSTMPDNQGPDTGLSGSGPTLNQRERENNSYTEPAESPASEFVPAGESQKLAAEPEEKKAGVDRRYLTPPTMDSEMQPGETVEDYVKRACRTSFLNKPLQHLQASERIRNLSSDTEKIEQARLLLSAA